jgi:hypothetical protein
LLAGSVLCQAHVLKKEQALNLGRMPCDIAVIVGLQGETVLLDLAAARPKALYNRKICSL